MAQTICYGGYEMFRESCWLGRVVCAAVVVIGLLIVPVYGSPYSPPQDFANADFETGSLNPEWDSWITGAASGASVYQGSGGNHYAHVWAMPFEEWMPEEEVPVMMPGESHISQSVDVPTDATLLVFDYYGDAQGGGEILVEFSRSGVCERISLSSAPTWISGYEVVLPEDTKGYTTDINFRAFGWTDCGDAMLYLDNVHIVPEPTSIVVFTLSGLTIIGRRRRG